MLGVTSEDAIRKDRKPDTANQYLEAKNHMNINTYTQVNIHI